VLDASLERFASRRAPVIGVAAELVAFLLMAHGVPSVLAQVQPASLERLDDLVDRLLAEVRGSR